MSNGLRRALFALGILALIFIIPIANCTRDRLRGDGLPGLGVGPFFNEERFFPGAVVPVSGIYRQRCSEDGDNDDAGLLWPRLWMREGSRFPETTAPNGYWMWGGT